MKQAELLKYAAERQTFVANLRHQLHEIPEIGWEEEKTLQLIKREITQIQARSPLSFTITEKAGGIWVDLDFNPDYKRVLFRADIDGLPIQEETGLPFASKHQGKMHACGHDCHAAMLLGAFEALATQSLQPCYNIRFVWQRAEEVGTKLSGGSELVREGVLDGISYAYGLHISSVQEYGTMSSRPGPTLCCPDSLDIEVGCSGGHVMSPEEGSNAIDILTDIQLKLRGFSTAHFGPHEPIILVPSVYEAKVGYNIRPNRGRTFYALRHFLTQEPLQRFIAAIKKQVESIIQSYPTAHLIRFDYRESYPTLVNHPDNYAFVAKLLQEQGITTQKSKRLFGGEDFAYYLAKCPGSFWFMGARGKEETYHHAATFNPDESILHQGVAFWLLLAHSQYTSQATSSASLATAAT